MILCQTLCTADWDASGTHMFFKFGGRATDTYFLATDNGRGTPKLPAGGVSSGQELRVLNSVKMVPEDVESAISPDFYSYSRISIRRNLYRIPIP